MRLYANKVALPGSLEGDMRRVKYAILPLAAALYLLVALTVPGAFLVAADAAHVLDKARLSADHLASPAGHSPYKVAEAREEGHNPDHFLGAKRLRGLLESASGTEKVLVVILVREVPEIRPENTDAGYVPALVEREIQHLVPPPQFLQRPPPQAIAASPDPANILVSPATEVVARVVW